MPENQCKCRGRIFFTKNICKFRARLARAKGKICFKIPRVFDLKNIICIKSCHCWNKDG